MTMKSPKFTLGLTGVRDVPIRNTDSEKLNGTKSSTVTNVRRTNAEPKHYAVMSDIKSVGGTFTESEIHVQIGKLKEMVTDFENNTMSILYDKLILLYMIIDSIIEGKSNDKNGYATDMDEYYKLYMSYNFNIKIFVRSTVVNNDVPINNFLVCTKLASTTNIEEIINDITMPFIARKDKILDMMDMAIARINEYILAPDRDAIGSSNRWYTLIRICENSKLGKVLLDEKSLRYERVDFEIKNHEELIDSTYRYVLSYVFEYMLMTRSELIETVNGPMHMSKFFEALYNLRFSI